MASTKLKSLLVAARLLAVALCFTLAGAVSAQSTSQQQKPKQTQNAAKPAPTPAAKPNDNKSTRKTAEQKRAEREAKKKEARKSPSETRKKERETKKTTAPAAAKPATGAKAGGTVAAPKVAAPSFLGDFTALSSQEQRLLRIHPAGAADRQDLSVIVGQEFSTEISLDNRNMTPFDEVRVILSYEPDYIEPLAINDGRIAMNLKGNPTAEIDSTAGLLLYEATLAEGFVSNRSPILTVRWKARKVSTNNLIEFGARGEYRTVLVGEGKDLLGSPKVPNDGTLNMSLTILPEDPREAEALLAEPTLMKGTDAKRGGVTLTLVAPKEPVVVDEPFHVDVLLDNMAYSNLDGLGLMISFDPDVLLVQDADKDNWITIGPNILDGPFHEQFPWDFQVENIIYQARGLISYRMATGDSDLTRGKAGPIARIYAVARRPSAGTSIEFRFSKREGVKGTAVTYVGADCLGDPNVPGDGTTSVTFPVMARGSAEVAAKGR
jgi:hypothetical protein